MPIPIDVSDRLLAECFGRPQAHAELGRLCDTVGGRLAGTPSGAAGEAWGHELFERWGLERVRYEPFPVMAWERGALAAEVTAPAPWTLTAMAHGSSPRAADVAGPVIDALHGEPATLDALGEAVRGAIVLCDEGASPGQRVRHRSEKMADAAARGAAALMILSSADGGLPRTGTCADDEAPIPSLGISSEDGARLRRLLAAGAAPTARIRMTNAIYPSEARNVIAELTGRERPDEIVLAGAHIDSWDVATGATDNGLGSAIVLEMARALAAVPTRPRRTLRFALWGAEEIGLLGSQHYLGAHAAELGAHAAVMNFDMTGDPEGFWTPGHAVQPPLLAALATRLAALGLRPEAHRSNASLHSDHQPFMLAGVPIVGLVAPASEAGRRYYHSVGDTYEKVALPPMCRAAAAAAHAMWAVADAEDRVLPHLSADEVRAMLAAVDLLEASGFERAVAEAPPVASAATTDA